MLKRALLPLMLLPLPLLAQVAVRAPEGAVRVTVQAPKLAAFQPSPHELWVVAGGTRKVEIDAALATRAGWTVQPLEAESGAGVRIVSPRPRNWTVARTATGWTVSQGAATAPATGASYIMLNNGLAGGSLVGYPGGPRYRVVPTAGGGISGNAKLADTLHGVAQALDGTPHALAEKPAPVAGPAEPLPAAARPQLAAAGAQHVPADEAPKPTKPGGKIFSVFAAPRLKPVATPVAQHAALVEDVFMVEPASGNPAPQRLAQAAPGASSAVAPAAPVTPTGAVSAPSVTAALGEVYIPGTPVSFTLPAGYRLEDGKLQRTTLPNDPRTLAFARAYGAVADAASRAEEVAATLRTARPTSTEPSPPPPEAPARTLQTPTALSALAQADLSPTTLSPTTLPPEAAGVAALLPAAGRAADYLPGYLRALAALNEAQRRSGAVIVAASPTQAVTPSGPVALSESANALWYKTPQEVASAPAVVEARRALADHYLAWQRPTEALAELSMQPQRAPGVPAYPEDRLRAAIAHLAVKQPGKAQPLLRMDATLRPDERRLWQAVALQQEGQAAAAVEAWPAHDQVMETYPEWLRRLALLARADALLAAGLKSSARALADAAAKEYPVYALPPAWLLRQGLARLGTADEREGMELLAQAAANPTDANTAMHAKYAFVKALQRRNELDDHQVSDYLEDLRMHWRGDDLEEKVLADLGDAYLKQGDYRNALSRWRTLTRVYPETPGMPAITEKMTAALLGAFDPENPYDYDAITYLGLYFNFRELLPDDVRGDRVMERIGKILTETMLPERAIPVLEQVLQYRAEEPMDQARLALVLAEAYRQFGKPDLALRTLDKYKPMAQNAVQLQQWPLAEARALLDLSRPAEALAALQNPRVDDASATALELRSEAAWRLEDWDRLRDLLAPVVARFKPADLAASTDQQVMLLRLGYALTQLNNRVALEALLARYAGEWEKVPHLTESMAALATQAGVANIPGGGRSLAQVAGALGGLNQFTDQFRQRSEDVQRRAEEREEYNAKMRFMDLLPPPSM